jgi:hypothetical protein
VNTDPVIMKGGLVYADMKAAGWTDELLIQHGHATHNYTV